MAHDPTSAALPELAYAEEEDDGGLRITSLQDLFAFHRANPPGDSWVEAEGPCLNIERPHRLEFFTLIFITEGSGTHWIDFDRHDYGPGSLLVTSINQVQKFVPNDEVTGWLMQFTESFLLRNLGRLDALLLDLLYNHDLRTPLLHSNPDDGIWRAVDDLADEVRRADAFGREEMLQLLVKRVLLEGGRLREQDPVATNRGEAATIFLAFKRSVEAGFWRTRSAQSYASDLGVSYKHLNVICKATVGTTAKSFIDNAVVLEAKRRLAVDDTGITQIASALGFDEPSNFARFFSTRVGVAPRDYRASLRT